MPAAMSAVRPPVRDHFEPVDELKGAETVRLSWIV